MKKRKSRPPVHRRRSTFEHSLDYAAARLAKCIERRDQITAEATALDQEIPHLQNIVMVLSSDKSELFPSYAGMLPNYPGNSNSKPPQPEQAQARNPDLSKYFRSDTKTLSLQPVNLPLKPVDPMPDDENAFLDGQRLPGEELLP
jgi:hypothetical protein